MPNDTLSLHMCTDLKTSFAIATFEFFYQHDGAAYTVIATMSPPTHRDELVDIESGTPLLERTPVTIDTISSEIQVTNLGLQFRSLCWTDLPLGRSWSTVPFGDILAVKLSRGSVLVYTFRRNTNTPSKWYPKVLDVDFGSKVPQKECMLKVIQNELSSMTHRPKRLLFFVNPVSGNKQAVYKYKSLIQPFFTIGGISCDMVETKEFRDEGCCEISEIIRKIHDSDISYDGIIGVGGDGMCTKLINVCSKFQQEDRGLLPIPLGHVPCGSTDALSSSLHGTRCMFTSMMHIALGDRMDIDSLEISLGTNRTRYSVCIATCGFMADVIQFSDSMRVLGPFRYDIAGFIKLMHNRSYKCSIRYIKANIERQYDSINCTMNCPRCASVSRGCGTRTNEHWTERSPQEYMSIMILNTACISDKSRIGMYKYGHLADGCSYLVMVKKCSPLDYLLFLLAMSKFGLSKYDDRHVEIVPVHKVEWESKERNPLCWNLDGELASTTKISVLSCYASVQVFARGIET